MRGRVQTHQHRTKGLVLERTGQCADGTAGSEYNKVGESRPEDEGIDS